MKDGKIISRAKGTIHITTPTGEAMSLTTGDTYRIYFGDEETIDVEFRDMCRVRAGGKDLPYINLCVNHPVIAKIRDAMANLSGAEKEAAKQTGVSADAFACYEVPLMWLLAHRFTILTKGKVDGIPLIPTYGGKLSAEEVERLDELFEEDSGEE